jgi:hypothetical protein
MDVLSGKKQSEIIEMIIISNMVINQSERLTHEKLDLKNEIELIQGEESEIEKQVEMLKSTIIKRIKSHLVYFNKDSIIVAIMSLKQFAISQRHSIGHTWELNALVEISVLLQSIIIDMPVEDFSNSTINIDVSGFYNKYEAKISKQRAESNEHIYSCLLLSKEYLYLKSNEALFNNGYNLKKLSEFLEDFFETSEDKVYYDEYLDMGNNFKPEMLGVTNLDLAEWLLKKKITNLNNYNLISTDLKSEIGFNIKELDSFQNKVALLYKIQEDVPMLINTMANFKELLEEVDQFDKIIEFFSINRLSNMVNVDERHFELRCFYKFDEFICFGVNDVLESIIMFKNIILSGDFVEKYYFIETNRIKNLPKSKNNMSTALAYKIVDQLEYSGYIVPYQKFKDKNIPLAEVRDLYNEKGKNIFVENEKDYGDIDILAGNIKDKIIYNIEFKYFAPGITYKEIVKKDKNKIKSNYINQIKGREKVIIEHKQLILKCLGIEDENYNDYKVKSFLVTGRPNYYAVNNNDSDVEFLSWGKLLERIRDNQL